MKKNSRVQLVKLRRRVFIPLVVALLGLAFFASPAIAPKAPPQEFLFDIDGDVDATRFAALATNKAASKFEGGAEATVSLDGLAALTVDLTSHLTFACDARNPVGDDPKQQQLDDATWIQGTLRAGTTGGFFMRFQLSFLCDTNGDGVKDGRDNWLVILGFDDVDFTTVDGVRIYDSCRDGVCDAHISVIHNAFQDDPDKKGKKEISHFQDGHRPFAETFLGDITVTITPCGGTGQPTCALP